MPGRKVFVVGVGMTNFDKPKKKGEDGPTWVDYGVLAVNRAIEDACIDRKDVEQVVAGSMFQTGFTQRISYACGLQGVPMTNVHNACATGSNAVYLARQAVAAGDNECALAFGVEKMQPGSLGGGDSDGSPTMLDKHAELIYSIPDIQFAAPPMPTMFGQAGLEHKKLYGSTKRHLAMIAAKNHKHSANNPYSQFKDVYTVDEIMNHRGIFGDLTKTMCSPTSDGAACVIVASEDFVKKNGLEGQAVEIKAMALRTDEAESFAPLNTPEDPKCAMKVVGGPMAKTAAAMVFKQAGIKPNDVDVAEVHDCFASNELITYEAVGWAAEGKGHEWVDAGENDYGCSPNGVVVNPSGGLESKGHPLGASGCAMVAELCWQLRHEAGPRQVPNARLAFQHNLGLGGAVVCAVYERPAAMDSAKPKRARSGAMGFPQAKL